MKAMKVEKKTAEGAKKSMKVQDDDDAEVAKKRRTNKAPAKPTAAAALGVEEARRTLQAATTPQAATNEVNKGDSLAVAADPPDVAGRMTRMVNALQYHAEHGKNKDKSSQAKLALETYFAIEGNGESAQSKRRDFLATFEATGGKGKDGLKWTVDYTRSARHDDVKTIASTENMVLRLA